MMMLEEALYSRLSTYAGLVALVAKKIYPGTADQNAALPYIVFDISDDEPVNALNQNPTLTHTHVTFSIWAGSRLETKKIKQQLVAAIAGFKGQMGGSTGVDVGSCLKTNEIAGYEGDPKTFFLHVEFSIWHNDVS